MCPETTTYVSSSYYIYVLTLLHTCPHGRGAGGADVCIEPLSIPQQTTICVFSYYYIRVRTLLYMCRHTRAISLYLSLNKLLYKCPHAPIYLAASNSCMCPHATGAGGAHVFIEPLSIPQQHRRVQ
jgi:hypothetical protein